MSVDYDARLEYGYKVKFEDIPNARERMENEFEDCADEPDGYKVTIRGEEVWCSDLATGDNGYEEYEDQDWYIGVSLPCEIGAGDVASYCMRAYDTVREMYELVMRRPPDEEPMIRSYLRIW